MNFSDDSIVFQLRISDEKAAADVAAAFSRLQKQQTATMQVGVGATEASNVSRGRELQVQRMLLQQERLLTREKQLQAKAAEQAAGKDPMGKTTGGVRGKMKIEGFGDLANSFVTMEGLRARTLSLFAGQIGTLMAFNAAMSLVDWTVRTIIGSQLELMDATARLGVVLHSEHGNLQADLLRSSEMARQWALSHGQGAAEITGAMYDLGAAGLRTLEVLRAMPAVALLAQGGFIELAQSSEIVSTSMQTFAREGLQPLEAANLLQATAANTQVTVEGLGQSLKYVAGTAVTTGMSFEELNALLGTLGTLGLRGSIAGTSLNQAFTQLVKNRDRIRALGIEIEDASGRMKPFTEIVAAFREKFGTVISVGESKLLKEIFDVRGGRAMERLISDVSVLPRTLDEVRNAQGEVFRAAEQGADTLSESWRVFGNSLKQLLMEHLRTATILKGTMDWITNRSSKRAAANIEAGGVQGLEFELDRLNKKFAESDAAGQAWIISLQGQIGKLPGLAREIRDVAALLEARGELIDTEKQLGGMDEKSMHAYWQAREKNMRAVWKLMLDIRETQEDLIKAGDIVHAVFGIKPSRPNSTAYIKGIVGGGLAEQKQYAEAQARYAELRVETFKKFTDGIADAEIKRLEELAKYWGEKLKGFTKDQDVAAQELAKERAKNLAQLRIELARSEITALEANPRLDFESQRTAARMRLGLELQVLEQERQARQKQLTDEYATAEESVALDSIYANLKIATKRQTQQKLRDIGLEELQEAYSAQQSIRELEFDAMQRRLDVSQQFTARRQRIEDKFAVYQENLVNRYAKGGLTVEAYNNELRRATLERDQDLAKVADDERSRRLDLMRLGAAATVAEARQLTIRGTAADQFNAERIAAWKAYRAQELEINLRYANDEERRDKELKFAWEEHNNNLTKTDVAEEQFRLQVKLNSINVVSDAMRNAASLTAALWGDATAKVLSDASAMAGGVSQAMQLYEQIQSKSVNAAAGWVGIVGIGLGMLTTLFDRQDKQERRARALADEFRHQEGRNVSADFGRAQIINVHVELNPEFRYLGNPRPDEQRRMAVLLVDDVIDILREQGVVDR